VDGAATYVVEGETGFVVPENQDAQKEVLRLHGGALEPWSVSLAAQSRFDYGVMIAQYAALVERVAGGESW
jgi:hypothetical protein